MKLETLQSLVNELNETPEDKYTFVQWLPIEKLKRLVEAATKSKQEILENTDIQTVCHILTVVKNSLPPKIIPKIADLLEKYKDYSSHSDDKIAPIAEAQDKIPLLEWLEKYFKDKPKDPLLYDLIEKMGSRAVNCILHSMDTNKKNHGTMIIAVKALQMPHYSCSDVLQILAKDSLPELLHNLLQKTSLFNPSPQSPFSSTMRKYTEKNLQSIELISELHTNPGLSHHGARDAGIPLIEKLSKIPKDIVSKYIGAWYDLEIKGKFPSGSYIDDVLASIPNSANNNIRDCLLNDAIANYRQIRVNDPAGLFIAIGNIFNHNHANDSLKFLLTTLSKLLRTYQSNLQTILTDVAVFPLGLIQVTLEYTIDWGNMFQFFVAKLEGLRNNHPFIIDSLLLLNLVQSEILRNNPDCPKDSNHFWEMIEETIKKSWPTATAITPDNLSAMLTQETGRNMLGKYLSILQKNNSDHQPSSVIVSLEANNNKQLVFATHLLRLKSRLIQSQELNLLLMFYHNKKWSTACVISRTIDNLKYYLWNPSDQTSSNFLKLLCDGGVTLRPTCQKTFIKAFDGCNLFKDKPENVLSQLAKNPGPILSETNEKVLQEAKTTLDTCKELVDFITVCQQTGNLDLLNRMTVNSICTLLNYFIGRCTFHASSRDNPYKFQFEGFQQKAEVMRDDIKPVSSLCR